ncbi:MAG: type II toxin-antitoxin system HicA family toxin [Thermaerobacter sp.]|nr:type II toxin-antitoxin system HicA family toxin [Thermaerobacter sp.]
MSRLARATGQETIVALGKLGFTTVRVSGNHVHLKKAGTPGLVTVPKHGGETLAPGLVRSILRQAGVSDDELMAVLYTRRAVYA